MEYHNRHNGNGNSSRYNNDNGNSNRYNNGNGNSNRYNNGNSNRYNNSNRRHDDDDNNNIRRRHVNNDQDYKQRDDHYHKSRSRNNSTSSSTSSSSSYQDDTIGHINVKCGDIINNRYTIIKELGIGTFGKVLYCNDSKHNDHVAIKVIRKIEKYVESAEIESRILGTIYEQQKTKEKNTRLCVKLYSHFRLNGHYFMVFETLGKSLFDIIKNNNYIGFNLNHTKHISQQLLKAMDFLESINLIHTDLKLENILLVNDKSESIWDATTRKYVNIPIDTRIKVIDFGGATFEHEKHSTIINTRQYRGPEVTLELGWSFPSDIWSVGCMIAEIYSGDLLFTTHDNLEHLSMMEKCCGPFPHCMIQNKVAKEFFHSNGRLRSEKLSRNNINNIRSMKTLPAIFTKEQGDRDSGIVDLMDKLLILDPNQRINAKDALLLPFFNV